MSVVRRRRRKRQSAAHDGAGRRCRWLLGGRGQRRRRGGRRGVAGRAQRCQGVGSGGTPVDVASRGKHRQGDHGHADASPTRGASPNATVDRSGGGRVTMSGWSADRCVPRLGSGVPRDRRIAPTNPATHVVARRRRSRYLPSSTVVHAVDDDHVHHTSPSRWSTSSRSSARRSATATATPVTRPPTSSGAARRSGRPFAARSTRRARSIRGCRRSTTRQLVAASTCR